MLLGCGKGRLGLRLAWVSAAEGAVLCALGAGCDCDEISWRVYLLLRVRCSAPLAWDGTAGVATGGGFCRRGCGVVLPRRGLGVLRL